MPRAAQTAPTSWRCRLSRNKECCDDPPRFNPSRTRLRAALAGRVRAGGTLFMAACGGGSDGPLPVAPNSAAGITASQAALDGTAGPTMSGLPSEANIVAAQAALDGPATPALSLLPTEAQIAAAQAAMDATSTF